MAAAASATILIELMDALTPGLATASRATAAWEKSMAGAMSRMGAKMSSAGKSMSLGLTLPIAAAMTGMLESGKQLSELHNKLLYTNIHGGNSAQEIAEDIAKATSATLETEKAIRKVSLALGLMPEAVF